MHACKQASLLHHPQPVAISYSNSEIVRTHSTTLHGMRLAAFALPPVRNMTHQCALTPYYGTTMFADLNTSSVQYSERHNQCMALTLRSLGNPQRTTAAQPVHFNVHPYGQYCSILNKTMPFLGYCSVYQCEVNRKVENTKMCVLKVFTGIVLKHRRRAPPSLRSFVRL